MEFMIREVSDGAELRDSASVIRRSFRTVADEFGLTRENCPTHTSFLTTGSLRDQKSKGLKCFGLFGGEKQVGFVGVERDDGASYWIEKLAVLPAYRHGGYGAKLVGFALDYMRQNGGTRARLGMMNEHTVLKDWYLGLGFREAELRRFPHLPFTVCLMEKEPLKD